MELSQFVHPDFKDFYDNLWRQQKSSSHDDTNLENTDADNDIIDYNKLPRPPSSASLGETFLKIW